MGKVEDLYKKKQIFEDLFGTLEFEIETSHYEGDKKYLSFYVMVHSYVNMIEEEIVAVATSIQGEITHRIPRILKSNIIPQKINTTCDIILLEEDANELLATDDWNIEYPDILMDAIEDHLKSIKVTDELGKTTPFSLSPREVYLLE